MRKVNNRGISNEEIIAALIQHGTIKAAAEAVGISPRAIYDRMNDVEFRKGYMEAKNDIIRGAVFSINGKLSAAIDTITEIMTNKENTPATRMQAAQIIINNAGKFAERLAAGEYSSRQEGKSPFDIFD